MEMKLSTERFDIISSGSVIIPSNDYVEFAIENLRFRFNMIQNRSDSAQGKYQTNIERDEKGECLVISLINFSSSFFATPNQELRLAHLHNKALWLRFSITSINRSSNGFDGLLFYTWMLSKEDEVVNPNAQNDGTEQ